MSSALSAGVAAGHPAALRRQMPCSIREAQASMTVRQMGNSTLHTVGRWEAACWALHSREDGIESRRKAEGDDDDDCVREARRASSARRAAWRSRSLRERTYSVGSKTAAWPAEEGREGGREEGREGLAERDRTGGPAVVKTEARWSSMA